MNQKISGLAAVLSIAVALVISNSFILVNAAGLNQQAAAGAAFGSFGQQGQGQPPMMSNGGMGGPNGTGTNQGGPGMQQGQPGQVGQTQGQMSTPSQDIVQEISKLCGMFAKAKPQQGQTGNGQQPPQGRPGTSTPPQQQI